MRYRCGPINTGQARHILRFLALSGMLLSPLDAQVPAGRAVAGRLPGPVPRETRAVVLFFVASDCPVSNRLFPEMQRLVKEFTPDGLQAWYVYPNMGETAVAVAEHQAAFGRGGTAVQDPGGALVRLSHAVATPEMSILVPAEKGQWRPVYTGRIDNRYVRLGLERPAATVHDGEDALRAVLAGRAPSPPAGPPVGCAIMGAATR